MAVALYNNTHKKITVKKGTIVAKVATANVIPPMLAPASGTFQNVPDFGAGLDGNECKTGMYHPMEGTFLPDHQSWNLPKRDQINYSASWT